MVQIAGAFIVVCTHVIQSCSGRCVLCLLQLITASMCDWRLSDVHRVAVVGQNKLNCMGFAVSSLLEIYGGGVCVLCYAVSSLSLSLLLLFLLSLSLSLSPPSLTPPSLSLSLSLSSSPYTVLSWWGNCGDVKLITRMWLWLLILGSKGYCGGGSVCT